MYVCLDRTIFGRDATFPNIEKIAFKVAQIKFLAMHITNQKLHFYIFAVGNLLNIFIEHDFFTYYPNDFWH